MTQLFSPWFIVVILLSLLTSCGSPRHHGASEPILGKGGYVKRGNPYEIDGKMYYPLASAENYMAEGIASWYGEKFHGKMTANGETYDMYAMTAAHTTLPMPSMVLVTNLETGKQIKVRVNDRGPFVKDRLIDLSYAAAKALGFTQQGTVKVRVQTLDTLNQAFTPSTKQAEPSKLDVVKPVATQQNTAPEPVVKQAYIQVGAFAEKSNADGVVKRLMASLDNHLPPAQVVSETHIHRVRIGPFDLDVDAEQALVHVQSHGYDSAMIVHD